MENRQRESSKRSIGVRVVVCLVILLMAGAGFIALKSMKKAPVRVKKVERPLKVATIVATRKDVPVVLSGHGELRSIRTLSLAAEVSGKVSEIHPHLETGAIITGGELLFAINDVDFRTSYDINRTRLTIIENDLALARKELKRVKTLFEKNKVGTESGVESSQKAENSVADRAAQVRQAMIQAKINFDRCRVHAPFTGRIVSADIEAGQYVSPGKTIIVMADDSALEVEIPIYGRDGVTWLTFSKNNENDANWFGAIEPVDCQVYWTEAPTQIFHGTLHRVSSFSSNTRSLKVVVRINGEEERLHHPFPLTSGMFVAVAIPGRTMHGVIELPRTAVSFENSVHVIRDGRLYSVPVEVTRVQGDKAYVSKGINEGDQVITTRLIDPLEGSLVQVITQKNGGSQ